MTWPKVSPTVKLRNGMEIPAIGLGTYKSLERECYIAVKKAIDAGYRHIDTALYYQNEKEIGQALSEKIADNIVTREDMFITSKLWNTFHRPDLVEPALEETLKDLKTEYVDLYLMHWPTAFQDGWNLSPKNQQGKMLFSDVDFIDTWRAMECLVQKGKAKSIGLSNFNKTQILKILEVASVHPVNLQIEIHPYLVQRDLVDFCHSKDISVTAYRPLGGPPSDSKSPIHNPKLLCIAEKYGKSPSQIMIRFLFQRNIIAIPKSSNPDRMVSNIDVFDFNLDNDDMAAIMSMDKEEEGRMIVYEVALDHKDYPFKAEC